MSRVYHKGDGVLKRNVLITETSPVNSLDSYGSYNVYVIFKLPRNESTRCVPLTATRQIHYSSTLLLFCNNLLYCPYICSLIAEKLMLLPHLDALDISRSNPAAVRIVYLFADFATLEPLASA